MRCAAENCVRLLTWIWIISIGYGGVMVSISKRHRFKSLSQQSLFSLSWRCKMVIHVFSHTMEQRRQLESQLWQLDIDKTIFSAQLRFSSLLRRVVGNYSPGHKMFTSSQQTQEQCAKCGLCHRLSVISSRWSCVYDGSIAVASNITILLMAALGPAVASSG